MFQTKVTFADWQTPEQRKAHLAHWRRKDAYRRTINNGLGFWRICAKPACRRNRSCSGDMHACFERHWAAVPEDEKEYLRGGIMAKRDGATGDEIVRRADYLQSLEPNNAPAASWRADDRAAAPPMGVRIRRL